MILDRHRRPLGTLRLSVTDRCNLRCVYCMPEDDYVWLPDASILTADELERVARVFVSLGVREVRITGGEPLLRADIEAVVARIAAIEVDGAAERGASPARKVEVALTTNGVLFEKHAGALARAGLSRVTFSVDTLRPERARALSRTTRLDDVLAGLRAARAAGLSRTKINAVVMRGKNDDELGDLVALARDHGAEVRFIEYMDVGGATRWSPRDVVSKDEILAALGGPERIEDAASAPAARYRLEDGSVVGVIASMTAPFCAACDRARVTADGVLFGCLYAERGVDLSSALRAGATDDDLRALVSGAWEARDDRGAETRAAVADRRALVPLSRLRADPHREMHTRGG
jgi:cyclic pyranopterin phosphate synthase